MIEDLRKKIPFEEFDYQLLLDALKEYKKPRDKITRLMESKEIIRVKKGLYVFGEKYRKEPISREVLANLIYGPSYISLEYALSYYGMIPERVSTLTSMTCIKNKLFHTPIGDFSYKYIELKKYGCGIHNLQLDSNRYCLIAAREKALADIVALQRTFTHKEEVRSYLIQSLRIEENEIFKLDPSVLREIAQAYHSKPVNLLLSLIGG